MKPVLVNELVPPAPQPPQGSAAGEAQTGSPLLRAIRQLLSEPQGSKAPRQDESEGHRVAIPL